MITMMKLVKNYSFSNLGVPGGVSVHFMQANFFIFNLFIILITNNVILVNIANISISIIYI